MADLIMQDTFEPYYAGREDDEKRRDKSRRQSRKQPARNAEGEIVLPEKAPVPAGVVRRHRRPVAH